MKIAASTPPLRLQALGCFLIVMLFIIPAQGQTPDQGALAEVPAPLRARLVERMNLLFEYSRAQQWGNLYELLYEPTDNKEKYVKQNMRFSQQFGNEPILEFIPQSATLLYPNGGWWYIKGCAKQRKNESIVQLEADVQARLKNDEWYFSDFGISIPIDGEPKPCSSQTTKQNTARSSLPCHHRTMKKNRRGGR